MGIYMFTLITILHLACWTFQLYSISFQSSFGLILTDIVATIIMFLGWYIWLISHAVPVDIETDLHYFINSSQPVTIMGEAIISGVAVGVLFSFYSVYKQVCFMMWGKCFQFITEAQSHFLLMCASQSMIVFMIGWQKIALSVFLLKRLYRVGIRVHMNMIFNPFK